MYICNINHCEAYDLEASSFLQINSCGIENAQKEVTFSRSKGRSDYQLIYLISGHFEASYLDINHSITQGFVLYPPHTPQMYTDFKDTNRIWVHFNGHNILEILKDTQLEYGVHAVSFSPIVQNLLLQLIAEHNKIGSLSSEKGLFLYILYLLGKQLHNSVSINSDIQDAITFITANFKNKLCIDELAKSCKLSSSHFLRLFKEHTGMPPLAYQQVLRIEHAKVSLVSTQYTISEIAEQTGYSDPLYFSRVFKKITGVSPMKYRKNYCGTE